MTDTSTLTTRLALDAIAYERAPRYDGGKVNLRVTCADDFKVSVQASEWHYANDSHPGERAPYWRGDGTPVYPFLTFELGAIDGDDPETLAAYESGGVWAWAPRDAVEALLDSHGGAVAWQEPKS